MMPRDWDKVKGRGNNTLTHQHAVFGLYEILNQGFGVFYEYAFPYCLQFIEGVWPLRNTEEQWRFTKCLWHRLAKVQVCWPQPRRWRFSRCSNGQQWWMQEDRHFKQIKKPEVYSEGSCDPPIRIRRAKCLDSNPLPPGIVGIVHGLSNTPDRCWQLAVGMSLINMLWKDVK